MGGGLTNLLRGHHRVDAAIGEREELLQAIADAQEECQRARSYFQFVSEQALVEHAILRLAAAECLFNHLLHAAREQGVPWRPSVEG